MVRVNAFLLCIICVCREGGKGYKASSRDARDKGNKGGEIRRLKPKMTSPTGCGSPSLFAGGARGPPNLRGTPPRTGVLLVWGTLSLGEASHVANSLTNNRGICMMISPPNPNPPSLPPALADWWGYVRIDRLAAQPISPSIPTNTHISTATKEPTAAGRWC